ncbi:MAG: hypothetical protein WB662_14125 [Methyloceanibacter sp.]
MPRACIFVDGENFRHSICEVLDTGEFDARDYLPKEADWSGFFDWLVTQACDDQHQRLRTYWYVLEGLDFFPYKFPSAKREADSLRITLCKDEAIANELAALTGNELIKRMEQIASELKSKQQNFMSRFRGWQVGAGWHREQASRHRISPCRLKFVQSFYGKDGIREGR